VLAPYAGELLKQQKQTASAEQLPALADAAGALLQKQKESGAWGAAAYAGIYAAGKVYSQVGTEALTNSADLLDPSYKFMSSTPERLQELKTAAQSEYDSIKNKDFKGHRYNDEARMSALRGDMTAIDRAMQRKVEPNAPTTWQENIAGTLRAEMGPTPGEERWTPPSPLYADTSQSKIATGLGQLTAYLTGGLLGPLADVAEFGGFTAQSAAGMREQAQAAGLPEEQQQKAAQMGALEGPINFFTFRAMNEMPWLRGTGSRTVGEFVTNTAKRIASFEVGSQAQRIADNVVVQASGIDPNRKMTEGLGQDWVENAVTATLFSGIAEGPSFALKAMGKARGKVYQGTPGAQPEGTTPGERTASGEPVTPGAAIPTEEEAAKQRAEAQQTAFAAFEPAAPEAPPGAPESAQARRAVEPVVSPTTEPEAPPSRREISQHLDTVEEELGPRGRALLADERTLPRRYDELLAANGQNRNNFKVIYDSDSGDIIVNPKNITSKAELNDALVRTVLPESLRDKATIIPVDSFHDHAADPQVAAKIAENPDVDANTWALANGRTGQVYINAAKAAADPANGVREAFKAAVHEIGGHIGIRRLLNDESLRDEFVRIYNGMEQGGMGQQIASMFGHTMESLAREYGFGRERPDGTWHMDDTAKAQMGDELLARYAERFSIAELDRAPNVIQKMVRMVRDGLLTHMGLKFNDAEAFDLIRKSWRAADPKRIPSSETALQARRISKAYVDPRDETVRANERTTREFFDVARGISEGRRTVQPEHGDGTSVESILESSDRLGAHAQSSGRIYDDGTLGARTSRTRAVGENAEHIIHDPIDPARNRYIIKTNQPGGWYGPYGLWAARVGHGLNAETEPAFHPENVKAGRYDQSAATAEQYATRLGLSNQLFHTGFHLEGFKHEPVNDIWSFVVSQPRFDNHRLATPEEIHHYMNERGFEGIDDRTFYDPQRKIAVFDAHPGNVLAHNDTGKIQPIDVVPMQLGGEFADHFAKLLDDPARLAGVDVSALERQLAGMGIDINLAKPTAEEVAAQARAEAEIQTEQARLEAKHRAQGGMMDPEEQARLDELQFGPFYKKDVETELGPGTEEIPKQVLKVAQSTIDAMKPGEAIREAARKTIKNPLDPVAVRAAAASPTQAVYEKTGQKVWEPQAEAIYRENGDDVGQVARALMSDKYGSDTSAYTYAQVVNDIRDMRAAAAGQPVRQAQLDALNSKLNKWFFQKGTEWGQEGAARNNAWYGYDGILAKNQKQTEDEIDKRVRRDPGFKDAVDKMRDTLRLVGEKAIADAKPVIEKAQEAHDRAMPQRIAEALNEEVARALKLAGDAANIPPDRLLAFENSIKAQIREQLPKIDRSTLQKLSEVDKARQAVHLWNEYEQVFNKAVDQMRHGMDEGSLSLFLQNLDRELDTPLGTGRLKGVLREAGVRIDDLVRQHRSHIGETAQSLADALRQDTHLTPEQAQALENVINTHLATAVDQKTRKIFDDIIDRANKGKPKAGGRPVTMKRLVELVNMGAFDDRQVAQALGPVFGYKGFDPAVADRIRALGDSLEEIKRQGRGPAAILANIEEMKRALARWRFDSMGRGKQAGEMAMNMYMGNLLSGIPTHVVALTSDFFNGMGNVATRLIATRRFEAIPELLYAIGKGFARGADTFGYIMRTGYDPGSNVDPMELIHGGKRYISSINSLDTDPSQRIAQKYGLKYLGMPIDWYKYIGRSITAAHSLMYEGWSAPIKYLTAYDMMRKDSSMSQGEALKSAHEAMWGDAARVQAAKEQATAEGLTGQKWRMRTQEIIDSTVDQGIRDIGDYYGRHTIYTQNPQGILGSVGRLLQRLSQEHPAARIVAPFTTVVSNLLNASLDYTPVGLLRGRSLESAEKYLTSGGEKMSDAQLNMLRSDLLIKGLMGTALTASFYLLAKQMGWQINGAGPTDPRLLKQMKADGWVPNSIRIGNLYLPFESTPLAVPFGMIGAYEDAMRYEKQPNQFKGLLYMVSNGMASIVDRSYLKGVTNLLDAFHGRADATGAVNAMQNEIASMKNFIPVVGSNFATQFYKQFVDNRMYQPNTDADGPQAFAQTLLRDVPFATSSMGGQPRLNILGEPVRTHPLTHRFWSTATDDEVWNWLTTADVPIGKPSKQTKLLGDPMTDTEFYDYSAFRGQQIKESIHDRLDYLKGLDPDERKKAIQHIENRADAMARQQVIHGEKPDLNIKGGH
jgi:hypothetical protein